MELFGRQVIYYNADIIDVSNLAKVIAYASTIHSKNVSEMRYLYDYYKGKQPIIYRTHGSRGDILNNVAENYAYEFVDFTTGYRVGEPLQYSSRVATDEAMEAVNVLNGYMATENKASEDVKISNWQNICGTAYRIVLPKSDYSDGEAPFEIQTLEPLNTFCVYSSKIGHRKLAGVYVIEDNTSANLVRRYCVYTPERYFEVIEGKIVKNDKNPLGIIPIIEYPENMSRIGLFEPVISIFDAINKFESCRVDAAEQFVQALLVLTNCNVDEGTTADDIARAGMIVLKSTNEYPATVQNIAEELDQTQNQMLKDDLYQSALSIVGIPSTASGATSDSSNNGAVILKNGWQTTEARAKKNETLWRECETEMLKVVLRICKSNKEINISPSNIKINFTRRNYEDIASKSSVLSMLLGSDWVSRIDAFTASGLFPDPSEACKRGEEYHDGIVADEKDVTTNATI